VLSVYFARGGFEATLAQEDRERDLDHTVSWSPAGQSYWTLIGQLVWNLRIRLGVALASAPPRVTLWSAAQNDAPVVPIATPPPPGEAPPMPPSESSAAPSDDAPPTAPSATHGRIAAAAGRATGRFGGDDFTWTADGFLRCPAGMLLRRAETRREPRQLRVIYVASASDCGACELAAQCRGRPRSAVHGRRVSVLSPLTPREPSSPRESPPRCDDAEPASRGPLSVWAPAASPPETPRLGSRPVWWVDHAASPARRMLREQLDGQHVVVETAPLVALPAAPFRTRDERAHRRQTWQQRLQRNHCPHEGTRVRVHGVPASLDELLGTTRVIPCAA
jgi:hypothetical protein